MSSAMAANELGGGCKSIVRNWSVARSQRELIGDEPLRVRSLAQPAVVSLSAPGSGDVGIDGERDDRQVHRLQQPVRLTSGGRLTVPPRAQDPDGG